MPDSAQTYTDLRSVEQYPQAPAQSAHAQRLREPRRPSCGCSRPPRQPLGPEEQLEVLESARQTITFVQHGNVVPLRGPPPAPDSQEDATLRQVVRLWTALSTAYARLAEGQRQGQRTSSAPSGRCSPSAASSTSARSSSNISGPTGPNRRAPGRPSMRPSSRPSGPASPTAGSSTPQQHLEGPEPRRGLHRPAAGRPHQPLRPQPARAQLDLPLGPAFCAPTASCRPTGRRTTPAPTASTSPKTMACARWR